jgi:hypothetical protein
VTVYTAKWPPFAGPFDASLRGHKLGSVTDVIVSPPGERLGLAA